MGLQQGGNPQSPDGGDETRDTREKGLPGISLVEVISVKYAVCISSYLSTYLPIYLWSLFQGPRFYFLPRNVCGCSVSTWFVDVFAVYVP